MSFYQFLALEKSAVNILCFADGECDVMWSLNAFCVKAVKND